MGYSHPIQTILPLLSDKKKHIIETVYLWEERKRKNQATILSVSSRHFP